MTATWVQVSPVVLLFSMIACLWASKRFCCCMSRGPGLYLVVMLFDDVMPRLYMHLQTSDTAETTFGVPAPLPPCTRCHAHHPGTECGLHVLAG
jgi:hypothetical protein